MSNRVWNLVGILVSLVWAAAVGAGAVALSGVIARSIQWPAAPVARRERPELPALREGREAAQARDHERAIAIYTAALDDTSTARDDRRALLSRRASALEALKRLHDAEADLGSALAVSPAGVQAQVQAYVDRGFFYVRRQRYDEALADFAAGGRIDPANPAVPFGEGSVHAARRDDAKAIERYSEAIRLNARVGRYYAERANAFSRLKQYDKAAEDYDRALELGLLNPRFVTNAHLGRGYALLQLKDFDRAIRDFDDVLKANPQAGNALGWRGYAYHSAGDHARARADYAAALAVAPGNAWVAGQISKLDADASP